MEKMVRAGESGGELIERLPQSLLLEILSRLDLESLCSAAPVCRTLRFLVSQALSSISTLDLSDFSPNAQILSRILGNNEVLWSLTVDCSRLDDSSVNIFAKEHLQELVLLRCCQFSSYIFTVIGEKCPNLRLLTLEMVYQYELGSLLTHKKNISLMLKGCFYLESIFMKFQSRCYPDPNEFDLESIRLVLPNNIKVLLLQPVSSKEAKLLAINTGVGTDSNASSADLGISYLRPNGFRLQSLSLGLDRITDELFISITGNLHLLVELCLEDKPVKEPPLHHDLTNSGLQSLGSCHHLTRLSLTRSKQYCPTTFRRVNDVGIFILTEGCKRLESITLGGFSKVTDAGYTSILHSYKNLKRFEIVNGFFLSDLAFHNHVYSLSSLVDVRLLSCNLLTCETAESLSLCKNLEVLDLSGCKSIADRGICSISKLCRLTKLDLGGADITDSGLSALGNGRSPIASLCLRGCKRVSDRGIALLLLGDGGISKTLSTLDLGYMPGVSDRAITTVAEVCKEITNLCIRHCYLVTDASIEALSSMEGFGGERRSLRRLDLRHCCGLSIDSIRMLIHPFFHGLRWLGIEGTSLSTKGWNRLMEISRDRPGLSICANGCEMGCKDGWQFHECV